MSIGRRNRRFSRGRLNAASRSVVECLETRQLLSGNITSLPIAGANANAWNGSHVQMVAGPDGNMWFTDPGDDAIGRMTPDGVSTLFSLQSQGTPIVQNPTDIIVGPDHNLWFTAGVGNIIGRITTAGKITEFSLPDGDGPSLGLTIGPDGKIWFEEVGAKTIAEVDSDGTVTQPYGILNIQGQTPLDGIAYGSDGNIWFLANGDITTPTGYDNGMEIDRVKPDGSVQGFPLYGTPTCIAAMPNGNIYVGTGGDQINDVWINNPAGPFAGPYVGGFNNVSSIEVGNDGSIYFASSAISLSQGPWMGQFGNITSDGITTYRLPDTATAIYSAVDISAMAQDSSGVFWFADSSSPRLIRWNMNTTIALTMNGIYVPSGVSTTSIAATFTDSAGGSDPSDYTVTATLYDGTVIPATITANGDGSFNISVTHTWTTAWDQWLTLSVDDHTNTWPVTQTGNISPYSNEPTSAVGVNISADTSEIFTGTVAQFTGLPSDLSGYSATIDWGDGTIEPSLIPTAGEGGIDNLIGSHIYTEPGTYIITATLQSFTSGWMQNGQIVSPPVNPQTTSTATVTGIHRLPQSGTGADFSTDTSEVFSGVVAHYADADLSSLSAYTATIEWGDGTQSTGTITANNVGGIDVAGSHQYTYAGSYGVTVALADSYGGWNDPSGKLIVPQPVAHPTATVTGLQNPNPPTPVMPGGYPVISPGGGLGTVSPIVVIGKDPIALDTPAPNNDIVGKQVHASPAKRFKATLGILKGIRHLGRLSALKGEITWGDGSTSLARFVRLGRHRIAVRGTHDYGAAGSFDITVDVLRTPVPHAKAAANQIVSTTEINTTASIAAPSHPHASASRGRV